MQAPLWLRNVAFAAFCLTGAGLLVSWLLPQSRVAPPRALARAARDWSPQDQAVVDRIDQAFVAQWDESQVRPTGPADELTVIRRLSLGLSGTVPSLEEIRSLERIPAGERIDWWVEYLLQDRRTSDYVAERLARAFVGVEDGPFVIFRRRRFVHWLSDQIEHGKPYDELVRQLLTHDGLWTDTPAVNFVSVTANQAEGNQPDPVRLAARTSRAFLGLRIDCLQCHDDNLGTMDLGSDDSPRGGTQEDFHQLAAFFSEVTTSIRGVQDTDMGMEYLTQYLHAEEEVEVPMRVPYREDLVPTTGPRRDRLAGWVTHRENRPFARAAVNRMWAIMSGRPLSEPVDDLPLHGPFPAGLELLADDFVAHDFDLHRLIRVIARTRAYRLSSEADFELTDEHEAVWAVYPVTQLRPEQIAGSTIQASNLKTINAEASTLEKLVRFGQEQEFVQRFGDAGEEEFDLDGGTIPQRLLLMNGQLVHERTQPSDVLLNASSQIAVYSTSDAQAVTTVYLTALTRMPTEPEREHFEARLAGTSGKERQQAIADILWALVNSSEFTWNH